VISLPYAEIVEPFEGWFDLAAKSSRIDYYHERLMLPPTSNIPLLSLSPGQVSTYQLGAQQQFGVSYKITPETTEKEQNVMKCFQVNGTKDEVVKAQASLPDVQGFQVCLCTFC
ncbi:hypothetical protein GOODEAATRI_009025, partial [Goodea atripinnis]